MSVIENIYGNLKIMMDKSLLLVYSYMLLRSICSLSNAADEEYPLVVWREATHNQRMEQMPCWHSSSAVLSVYG